MKKVLLSTLAVCIIAVSVSSCKSHEKCPAYSKVEKNHKQSA